MNSNLQFWYRYCTGISFCVVSSKLICCIINGVPRDQNTTALLELTATCCCAVLQSLFQLLLSGSGADPNEGPFSTMLLMNAVFP